MTYLSGLKQFIASWNDPFVSVDLTDYNLFKTSPEGNINSEGTSACCDSPSVPKYYRYFKKAIEPGVRDLAIALILKLDCITYSSCQGHRATNTSSALASWGKSTQTSAIMRQRYVAILPRDAEDYQRLFKILNDLADSTNASFPNSSVKIAIANDLVESEDCQMPGLVFSFVDVSVFSPLELPLPARIVSDENLYFREIEPVYRHVVELINNSSC